MFNYFIKKKTLNKLPKKNFKINYVANIVF